MSLDCLEKFQPEEGAADLGGDGGGKVFRTQKRTQCEMTGNNVMHHPSSMEARGLAVRSPRLWRSAFSL